MTTYGTIGVKVWIFKGLVDLDKGDSYAVDAKKS
jgi:ribosomal protein S3